MSPITTQPSSCGTTPTGRKTMMSQPHYPALVLNADYAPLQIWPLSTWDFERTLRNVMKERVTVVSEYDTKLRSPSFEYTPPSVVALKDYVKIPSKVPFSRMNILLRDDFKCQYCGCGLNLRDLTFDHVTPRARGGETSYENIVSACATCNTKKGSRMDMKPLRTPAYPNARELWKKKPPALEQMHQTWVDCLYWSGVLEQ